MSELDLYLQPTEFLDSDSLPVRDFAARATEGAAGEIAKAVALYYAIRDGIRYDPYVMATDPEQYRASVVAGLPAAYCIQKAILLGASARAVGVPSRLGFADVRNHLTSPKLRETMGSDLFVYHGYTELFLEGRWVKATPTYDKEYCRKAGVGPVEFDGIKDAMLPAFALDGRRNVEYLLDRGFFDDLPLEDIRKASASGKYLAP